MPSDVVEVATLSEITYRRIVVFGWALARLRLLRNPVVLRIPLQLIVFLGRFA